ncbi:MAG: hypothetical protein ACPG05_02305 [Bdellovibrionales bacterium]
MKVLVLVKSQGEADEVASVVETQGHVCASYSDWDTYIDALRREKHPILLVDQSFFSEHHVAELRRNSLGYVYIIGVGVDPAQALKMGLNSCVPNVSDRNSVAGVIDVASNFLIKYQRLSNEMQDFPSSGGVISKSAFNQLFLSSLDRTGRYGEDSYVLFFSIENYKNIIVDDSEYSARHATARLAYHLSKTRRLSDILAQTDDHEYALLFLSPEYKEEPLEATNRFMATLSRIQDYTNGLSPVEVSLKLYKFPSGVIEQEHSFTVKAA